MSNPLQRTASQTMENVSIKVREDLHEKLAWSEYTKFLNLATIDVEGEEYAAGEAARKSYVNTTLMAEQLSKKGGIKPLANIPYPERVVEMWEGEEEPAEDGDLGKFLFGTGNSSQVYGESGLGAELAVVGLRKATEEQLELVRTALNKTVMAGGGMLLGYSRFMETLKTKEEKNRIKVPKRGEVAKAMLRSRFPEMVVGPYGVTPQTHHLTRHTGGMTHVCASSVQMSQYVAERKLLFTTDSEYADARYLPVYEHVVRDVGMGRKLNTRMTKQVVFSGGIGPYPTLDVDKIDGLRQRMVVEVEEKLDQPVHNLVTFNMHARAGPMYKHKSLHKVIATVLSDAMPVISLMDQCNEIFVRASRQEETLPIHEAEEAMAVAMNTYPDKFRDVFDTFRLSNQALSAGALVAKTDKISVEKYNGNKARLYVEGSKAVQLPMAEFTQSVEELLKSRSVAYAYAEAMRNAAQRDVVDFNRSSYLTHSALGSSFPHGGADLLWSYVTKGITHGVGYMYMHSADDNFFVLRTDWGMVYARYDMVDYDKSICSEVKVPIVYGIQKLCTVANPGGAALWASEQTKTILVLNDNRSILAEDMQMSGVNMFDKINDVAMDICQSRALAILRKDNAVQTGTPETLGGMITDAMTQAAAGLGMKLRVEEIHTVLGVSTMKQFLAQQPVEFLGYIHYHTVDDVAKYEGLPRTRGMIKCYLNPKRLFTSFLHKSHFVKDHDEYRLTEAIRLASILLTAGVPPEEWKPVYDAMKTHVLKLLDTVKDMAVPDEEYDYALERAPMSQDPTKPTKEGKRVLAMVPTMANTPEMLELFSSVEGVRKALESNMYKIWLDNGDNVDYHLARMEALSDAEGTAWDDAGLDPASVITYLIGRRTEADMLLSDMNMATYERLIAADTLYHNVSDLFSQITIDSSRIKLRMLSDAELAQERALVKWENWGRVNANAAKRAEGNKRRRNRRKAKKRAERDIEEEKEYRPHEEKPDRGEARASLREAASRGDYDPFDDQFGEYSAAKNLGPNPRKKK